MTSNDLVYKMTARAKELVDKPLLELRLGVATAESHNRRHSRNQTPQPGRVDRANPGRRVCRGVSEANPRGGLT
jgi:hypothetical protein